MKYLKITPPNEEAKRKGTFAFLYELLEAVDERGILAREVRRRYRIMDMVEASEKRGDTILELEDDYALCLKDLLTTARFLALSREALELEDAIQDMMSDKTKKPTSKE